MATPETSKKSKKQTLAQKEGTCALLKIEGKFAKAHLIPKALTAPDTPGERFIEAGRGARPIRRFSSWFDHQLVITAGEKILSEIDDAGISELRRHRLIWSGWDGKKKLHVKEYCVPPDPVSGVGVRHIANYDSSKLRLFFLSLLWRSLATKIKEFSYLDNIGVDLDLLGELLVKKDPGPHKFLPIVISQISTVGFTHNHSPTIQEITHEVAGVEAVYRFYRFYMQGVIAHIYVGDCESVVSASPGVFVGGEDRLVVISHKFENSRQFEEAKSSMIESIQAWPNVRV